MDSFLFDIDKKPGGDIIDSGIGSISGFSAATVVPAAAAALFFASFFLTIIVPYRPSKSIEVTKVGFPLKNYEIVILLRNCPVFYIIMLRKEAIKMDQKRGLMTGDEHFEFNGMPQPEMIRDFWAWAMSRLIMDGPRGDLAEFIVRMALEEDIQTPKRGWGECDIVCRDGLKIEVKCSSLLQEWERDTPSKPVFSIAKTLNCDIADVGGVYRYVGRDGSPPRRRSDLYVFCLFTNADRETADPTRLEQWEFYVMATEAINEAFGDRRSVNIPALKKAGAKQCDFYEIQQAVDDIRRYVQQNCTPPPRNLTYLSN